ncbi:MAG: superoxide dismutase [Opitutaceae bacterium]|nr:superoxide dismutase [Opitutaceae bacterium]
MTRRTLIKSLGAGAALAGLGITAPREARAAVGAPAGTSQPFTLPPLGYDFAALEPAIDAQTMRIHHGKHHQGYINNANKALADYPQLQKFTAEQLLADLNAVPAVIRTAVRNNVGGHVNHSLFWRVLTPHTGGEPQGALANAIVREFRSFENFQSKFAAEAGNRFGSGWAWLSVKGGVVRVHSTANQDSPLSEGWTPILGLDVWEHAYYLHYQNRRADYARAFWSIVNWDEVAARFAAVG